MVKRVPAMWETRVRSLGREDPLEKAMAIHSSTLAWKIPWTAKPIGYSPWGRKESDTAEQLVPSLGTTDVLQVEMQIIKVVLQNRLASDILTAAQGGTCVIITTQCCTCIPDMSTNVTHFTKHMNKIILAMDTPEASNASFWGTLNSPLWWKTILITIILIFLFCCLLPESVIL